MPSPKRPLDKALDIALMLSVGAFILLVVNIGPIPGIIGTVALFGTALSITAIGIWRQAGRERALDEMELAGASFGARWGICAVILLALLSTFLAPLQELIGNVAAAFSAADGHPVPPTVRVFLLGLLFALVLQLSMQSLVAAIWQRTKR